MKYALKVLGLIVLLLVVLVGASYTWASVTSSRMLDRDFTVHQADFPIPFPLDSMEIADLDLTPEQADSAALARATERGQHLVNARYGCTECHGADFSGGVMVDAFPLGTLLGPNITTGAGSRSAGFGAADWDRIVRHGVTAEGKPALMPSLDFVAMSDQELSDIVTYVRSQAGVDNDVERPSLGPLGKFLVTTGALPFSVDLIPDHDRVHVVEPPAAEVSVEFGKHLAGVCTGCHQTDLAGGVVPGGDPSWAPARNLTPNADGSPRWSLEEFVMMLREGQRADGTAVLLPMTLMMPYANNMTDVELEAIYTYLTSLPSVADRN